MTSDEIINKLKKKEIAPVYLLHGEEPFFIDQISNYMEENLLAEEEKDMNEVVMYAKDVDAAEVVAQAKAFPFGADFRLVILKEAKDLREMEKLKGYVENPSPNTVLVICHKYGKVKATSFTKACEKTGVVFDAVGVKDWALPDWVLQRARALNLNLAKEEAVMLSEYIGNDLSRINNELNKLKLAMPDPTMQITCELIQKNIGISKDFNIFELQDALGNRNPLKSYQIALNFAKKQKENPNIKTILMLYKFYNKLLAYHLLPEKSPAALNGLFGSYPKIRDNNVRYALRYSQFELKRNIALLREFDAKAKGVDSDMSPEELIKELIYRLLN